MALAVMTLLWKREDLEEMPLVVLLEDGQGNSV
jgi:hypothetical protein